MMRLAIITSHPVQYYAPFFKLLNERKKIAVKVFYTWGEQAKQRFDPGFREIVEWDIPLLEGYDYEWAQNQAADPGTHHFKGIITPGLAGQVSSWHPDAVLVYGWAYHSHLQVMRYFRNKVPVYFRGDSNLVDAKSGIRSFARSLVLKWVYRHVSHAFYTGTHSKAYFKRYGLKENQLSFGPHAVDNGRFFAGYSAEALSLRRNLGIRDEATVILFAGKLEAKKSPQLLLTAFAALQTQDAHLLFVGNGLLEKDLKEKSAAIKHIHFMPFQNQSYMPVVFQSCDLFCLPSGGPGETWGLAVNEAMASGKAVLLSDKVGCGPDLVKDNYNGKIFRAGDLHALTTCLEELAGSKSLLASYGKHSKAVIANWNFEITAEAIEDQLLKDTGIEFKR